jgi:hypothetical protein
VKRPKAARAAKRLRAAMAAKEPREAWEADLKAVLDAYDHQKRALEFLEAVARFTKEGV